MLLPDLVAADAAQLANQCPAAQFAASTCPANTIVGEARAESPLQPAPLIGTVSIVKPPTPGLPQLGVDLKGALAIQLLGNFVVQPAGNVFDGLPDIPISRFKLTFDQDRLVLTSRDLCEAPTPLFGTDFTGHNGVRRTGQVEPGIAGCTPSAEVKLTKTGSNHPRMKAKIEGGGSTLSKVKLKLPRQLKFGNKKSFKRGAKATGDGSSLGKKALKRRSRSLKLKAKSGAKTLEIKARKRALKRVKKIKKGRKLRFKIKVEDVGGFTTNLKARAKAR